MDIFRRWLRTLFWLLRLLEKLEKRYLTVSKPKSIMCKVMSIFLKEINVWTNVLKEQNWRRLIDIIEFIATDWRRLCSITQNNDKGCLENSFPSQLTVIVYKELTLQWTILDPWNWQTEHVDNVHTIFILKRRKQIDKAAVFIKLLF